MDKRVKFDFEIDFINGGGIQGRGFRLDIPGADISERELADYIVRDLRLLMAGEVRIRNKEIITEAHKRPAASQPEGNFDFVDLSHTVFDGLVTYKGLPAARISDYLTRAASRPHYEPGTEFYIAQIEMISNTGTYVDCPFHRYEDGKDLSEVRLDKFVDLQGIVIRADHHKGLAVNADFFKGKDLRGRAVLVNTGWDEHWATGKYFEDHPFLTREAAEYLKESGARLVGIDALNIDDTRGKARPVHSILLRSEILVVEHLCNLGSVPDEGFTFNGLPPKFKGVGTFPIRAYARIKKD